MLTKHLLIITYGILMTGLSKSVLRADSEVKETPKPIGKGCLLKPVTDVDGQLLTKKEEIKKLDEAFYKSLQQYDDCNLKLQNGVRNGKTNGSEAGAFGSKGNGTGADGQKGQKGQNGQSQSLSNDSKYKKVPVRQQSGTPVTVNNGAIPKDIPPADNDSILQQQIREAAMKEKDPEKRKKLWEMYRKYKNKG